MKENALRLYRHYVEVGNKDAAEDMKAHILKKYKIDPDAKPEGKQTEKKIKK